MAHYDCTNCGHPLGIAFGRCEECTPQRYFDLQQEISQIAENALVAWREHSKQEQMIFVEERLNAEGYYDKKEELLNISPL